MEQQFIEEHDIKIEEIKVEQEYAFYNWVNDLELQDNKNWSTQFQPIMIEARVNLTPVEKVCKCKKDVPLFVEWPQNIRNIVICFTNNC